MKRRPYFASRKVSTVKNILTGTFNPDVVIVLEYESHTGNIRIKSGNQLPLNAIQVAVVAASVAKSNIDVVATQLTSTIPQSHIFQALPGETKCRVPRCGQTVDHEIHQKDEPVVQ